MNHSESEVLRETSKGECDMDMKGLFIFVKMGTDSTGAVGGQLDLYIPDLCDAKCSRHLCLHW